MAGGVRLDACEERLDTRGSRHAVVLAELDLGSDAKLQRAADARAQVRRGAVQSLERRFLLAFSAHHAHKDLRMSKVIRELDPCHGDESDDPWVLCRRGEERRYLFADRLPYAIRATVVTQWHSTQEFSQPAPCDSTR